VLTDAATVVRDHRLTLRPQRGRGGDPRARETDDEERALRQRQAACGGGPAQRIACW
jgi:hypothetical protein